jgi:glycosyltransferase involved in cell wall biosynthesis
MVRQLGLGGSERQLTEVARKLDRSRFTPYAGCFWPGGLRSRELEAAGVPVICFDVTSLKPRGAWSAVRRIAGFLRRNRIALVHTFDVPSTLMMTPVVRVAGRGIPGTAMLSSQRAHRELTPALGRWLLRISDRMVDGIVVNCEYLRRHLIEDERVSPGRIHLCRNGVDLNVFHPGANFRPPQLGEASLVIGVVCALRPEKGLDMLISAFARLRPERAGLRLAIVGSGPCLSALQAQAEELGVAGQCVFEPGTTEVAAWLRCFDVFVLPSRSEALSNSLMEAMACGCCVAASDRGGNPELVSHGGTGLLFPAGDVERLAAALRLLIEDADLRIRLGRAAAERMRSDFTIEGSARRMAEIYGGMLEGA